MNPEQAKAASHSEGPMMVLAGPGTGKTQVIAERIVQLLEHTQMEPYNLLCLTFTESGVVAMRKRLLEKIGPVAYQVRIHTFHSFCNELIQSHPERFIKTRELESLTEVECIQLFRRLIDEWPGNHPMKPIGSPYFYQRDLIGRIKDLKREAISPEQFDSLLQGIEAFLEKHGADLEAFCAIHGNSLTEADVSAILPSLEGSPLSALIPMEPLDKKGRTQFKAQVKEALLDLYDQIPKQKALLEIYRRYQTQLRELGRYDFEDMILFVVQRFKSDPDFLARQQEQFQYILVDEYQDTNGAQNEILELLGSYFDQPNLFVVGDDKQSIYRFQGASLENILAFYHRYKNHVGLVSLKQNYRSQQGILDAAHHLIQYNEHGLAKLVPELQDELVAAKDLPREPIQVAALSNPQTEAYFIAKSIQARIAAGAKASEIAVLYRNHRDVQDLLDLFQRMDLPFRLEEKLDVLRDRSLQKLLNLLRFLNNLEDNLGLFHVLHYDFLNFHPLDILKFNESARKDKRSYLLQMSDESTLTAMKLQNPNLFSHFAQLCFTWKALSENVSLMEFFDRFIHESGYVDFVMNQPEKLEHLNRLNSLFDALKQMNRANHHLTLQDFLSHLELLEENELSLKEHELASKKNGVRLMTAHKSKGLEFDHVYILNCIDKHWGNARSHAKIHLPAGLLKNDQRLDAQSRNEDERRLFYVAMTRARKTLTLSYANASSTDRAQAPSQFLAELEGHLEFANTQALEEEANDRFQTLFLTPAKPDHSEEEHNFVRALLENYKMSVTHLNNYLKCPRLFYYRNLLRVPGAKDANASFGSAVHRALHDFALEYRRGSLPSLHFLLSAFEKQLSFEVLTARDFKNALELGRDQLQDYYAQALSSWRNEVLPEYDFNAQGVHLDGIPLTGKIDKIEVLNPEAKTVKVVDYKTGNPDNKAADLAPNGDYHRQIVFYQLLCNLSEHFPYTMTAGEVDFIQKSKRNGEHKTRSYNVTEAEIEALKEEIRQVYQDIMDLRFLKTDEWTACGECEYCRMME